MPYDYFDMLCGFFGGASTQVQVIRKYIAEKVSLEKMVIVDVIKKVTRERELGWSQW